MPSFLSKVLRRKRDDREGSASEEIQPSEQRKEKSKSASSPNRAGKAKTVSNQLSLPQLSLNLSLDDTTPTLDDTPLLLPERTIGEKRLTPAEALGLVRTCSQSISARGVDTLGIMHPHWHSASPDIQQRLISLFIHSLTAPNSEASHSFVSEITSSRSPHDIAAVLRWGLRHLQLEGNHYGNDQEWYSTFFDSERKAGYPPKAFSQTIPSLVQGSHYQLLKEVLELFSSFASHAETNSTSGSKLSKVFGLWLLGSPRFVPKEDWQSFYDRWETTGRQLEHLFLARIRDEAVAQRIPTRLLELVKQYPYSSSPSSSPSLLPRPKFTTRLYDTLLVRVETELPNDATLPELDVRPLRVIAEALSASDGTGGDCANIWSTLVEASKEEDINGSPLSRIFTDETIRFLYMVSDQTHKLDASFKHPTTNLLPLPVSKAKDQQRSFSLSEFTDDVRFRTDEGDLAASSTDWTSFSSGGFGSSAPLTPLASTLLTSEQKQATSTSGRHPKSPSSASGHSLGVKISGHGLSQLTSKVASRKIVKMDEAFVDFWSDTLLDLVSSRAPAFVVCELRPSLASKLTYNDAGTTKTLQWVVLEHAFKVKPPPTPVSIPTAPSTDTLPYGRPSSVTSTSKRRYMFWSPSKSRSMASITSDSSTTKGKKDKTPKGFKVSELGEVLGEDSNESPAESHSGGLTVTAADKRSSLRSHASRTDVSTDTGVTATAPPVVHAKEEGGEDVEVVAVKEEENKEPQTNGGRSVAADGPAEALTVDEGDKKEAEAVEPTAAATLEDIREGDEGDEGVDAAEGKATKVGDDVPPATSAPVDASNGSAATETATKEAPILIAEAKVDNEVPGGSSTR